MPVLLLLIVFVTVPLIEIAIFIEVGGWIGLWPTLGVVIVTAVAGTWLLRMQGRATLMRVQASLNREEFPAREVFDGLCLLFAGALLLTPGFFTDAVGFLLFVPWFRALLRKAGWRYLQSTGKIRVGMPGSTRSDDVIDGDFEEVRPTGPPKGPDKTPANDDEPRRLGPK